MANNLGELIVGDSAVQHRFWRPREPWVGGGLPAFVADEFLSWSANDWPVPRAWHELTPALGTAVRRLQRS